MNFEGVRGGGESVVGVTVPESGYAGDGDVEASAIEESMPERIAMPRVPARVLRQPCGSVRRCSEDCSKAKERLTTTKYSKSH